MSFDPLNEDVNAGGQVDACLGVSGASKTHSIVKRIPQLDGVRGFAVLLVVICHYVQNPLIVANSGIGAKYVAKALSLTWSGVDLFFVLSGFLICGILVDHRNSSNLFRTFYIRRTLRIFPLYLLSLGLFVIFSGMLHVPRLFENPMPLWSYLTCTQNFAMVPFSDGTAAWLGLTWSLAVEEQFYLLLPLVIFWVPVRALLPVLCTGVAGAVILRALFPGHQAFLLMPWRADSLFMGSILAVLIRRPAFLDWVSRNRRKLLAVFGVLLLGAAAISAKPWSPWAHSYFFLALLYSVFLLIAYTDSWPWLTRCLMAKPLRWLGNVSYGVYLIHGIVQYMLFWYAGKRLPQIRNAEDIWLILLAFAITIALAALSMRYFEGPLLRCGHKFKYCSAKPNCARETMVGDRDGLAMMQPALDHRKN